MKYLVTIGILILFTSLSVSNFQPVSAQEDEDDVLSIIVTLFETNENTGDIIAFASTGNETRTQIINPIESRGTNGTAEVSFAFDENVSPGQSFRACAIVISDLIIACKEGINSPALRPEIVDINLSSDAVAIETTSVTDETDADDDDVDDEADEEEDDDDEDVTTEETPTTPTL